MKRKPCQFIICPPSSSFAIKGAGDKCQSHLLPSNCEAFFGKAVHSGSRATEAVEKKNVCVSYICTERVRETESESGRGKYT